MANTSIIVPCAVLGAIVGIGLAFFAWWFPRTWRKGQEEDIKAMEEADGQEDRAANHVAARGVVQRAIAREQALKRGEQPSDEPVVPASWYEQMRQREERKRGARVAAPIAGSYSLDFGCDSV